MDFYTIKERAGKNNTIEIYPDFAVGRSKDLMIRGRGFYAIWDEAAGLWSTDEYDVQRLVDEELTEYADKVKSTTDSTIRIRYMRQYSSNSWTQFRNFIGHISDNAHQLDTHLTFANTEVKKKDYVSRRLPYSLEAGPCEAYEELISVLYDPEERAKIEWAIGSIISGDSQDIQKFMVLYGQAGTGKSTILNIIQQLFEGYYTTFEAKALTSSNNGFSTEVFRNNPLIAIDHDGDLSNIADNTRLNSIVSHEMMTMNEKYKPSYTARANALLLIGTNKPVKITDAKSGIIRRLIDVHPSGRTFPIKRYMELISRIDFELGAIAEKCLGIYRKMGKNYYAAYRPMDMIMQTDVFFNFVESCFNTFNEQDGTSLSQAYEMYKTFCTESLIEFKLPRHKFREELKNYFKEFCDVTRIDGRQVRSYYNGFRSEKFTTIKPEPEPIEQHPSWVVLDKTESLLDDMIADCSAQYASRNGLPANKWKNVETHLKDIDTKKVHYVKLPVNHIVIDIDLKDENGQKSAERSIEAAAKWPPTYAEFSKSKAGIHLHYIYDGDATKLANIYEPGIEVKVCVGDAALRRALSKCNNIPVATIKSGLPIKEEKMVNFEGIKSEQALRTLIKRNLAKEIHPGTKPSIEFIKTILDEAYFSGLFKYDVSDMRQKIVVFATNSTNWPEHCLRVVSNMKFKSEEEPDTESNVNYESNTIVFYDVEVFPNLFVVCWKAQGKDQKCVSMINPKPKDIEGLMKMKLIGFNNRRYDNHILYAAYIGFNNEQLYNLSQKIIGDSKSGFFGSAYNLSYADVYDFSSIKQSQKKFQIDLGIHHLELGLPWDQPVPEDKWQLVADYCRNDVETLEEIFEDRKADFVAREILAELSGLSVNDPTQAHAAKIIFGDDKNPQDKFVYTDLRERFPGYVFQNGKSTYRGEEVGEGGEVYAEPGCYEDVGMSDVVSMHPSSIELLDLFGPYTVNYSRIKSARVAIKHKDFEKAKQLLGEKAGKFLDSPEIADALAYALKIVVNIVYGLTSASFPNKFRDPRNVDNIVAKRGALFMIDLRHAVQEQGYKVAHIKTDSIKIPNATPEIIKFVSDFGKKYGYEFEHEATYSRMCLVNDAVYVAKYAGLEKCMELYGYIPTENKKHPNEWTATGAQFAVPYVFKTLFTKESIVFGDVCETKSVNSAMYLDMNENLGPDEHNYQFVGKSGLFCPIKPGCGGGILYREKDGKYYAVTGTKGYRWLESELVYSLGKEGDVDESYYKALVEASYKDISKYTDFEWFVSEES